MYYMIVSSHLCLTVIVIWVHMLWCCIYIEMLSQYCDVSVLTGICLSIILGFLCPFFCAWKRYKYQVVFWIVAVGGWVCLWLIWNKRFSDLRRVFVCILEGVEPLDSNTQQPYYILQNQCAPSYMLLIC